MKFHAITTLATPLLALAITATASQMALAAQDDAVTEPEQLEREQLERPVTPGQDDTNADRQEVPLSDTDCVDIPDAASQDAQGAGAANAQGSRAEENRSTGSASSSDAQIAQNRDDCLDIRGETRATD